MMPRFGSREFFPGALLGTTIVLLISLAVGRTQVVSEVPQGNGTSKSEGVGPVYLTCSLDNTLCGLTISQTNGDGCTFTSTPTPPAGGTSLQCQVGVSHVTGSSYLTITPANVAGIPANPALDRDFWYSWEFLIPTNSSIKNVTGKLKQCKLALNRGRSCEGACGWAMYGFGTQFGTPPDLVIMEDVGYDRCNGACQSTAGHIIPGNWMWIKEHDRYDSVTRKGHIQVWFGTSPTDPGKLIYDETLTHQGWGTSSPFELGLGTRYVQYANGPVQVNLRNLCIAATDTKSIPGCH